MSKMILRRPTLQNDLYIRSEELSGAPAVDADSAEGNGAKADDLVRKLLIEEKRRTMPERLPEIVPQEDVAVYDQPEEQKESARDSIAQILKAERAGGAEATPRKRSWPRLSGRFMPTLRMPRLNLRKVRTAPRDETAVSVQQTPSKRAKLPAWLRNYRPTRKHIAWTCVVALMLYRPLMLPLVALLLFWVVLIAYLTLGPDRWGEILGSAWQRLHHRRPELAERVRQRADRFAEKFDRFLDRLPESWADRLALPDFSVATDNDEDKPDPFDRLAAEAREA